MTATTGKDPVACGIYMIKARDGRVYIGQSLNISQRFKQHRKLLKVGMHYNSQLQACWNEGDRFSFSVLEEVAPLHLDEREAYWIGFYGSLNLVKGFNLALIANNETKCVPCEKFFVKQWVVYRRLSDGYWNASSLFAQFEKRFDNWRRLQSDAEILSLIDSGSHGTWIHPDLAIIITSWLSPSLYLGYMSLLRETCSRQGKDLNTFLAEALSL